LEQVKLEISARIAEYNALRAEIVATLSSAFLTTNLTITGIGVLFAASPFILKSEAPYLFLLAAFMFYLIAWTQLRFVLAVFNISQHLDSVTAPRLRRSLRKVVKETGDNFDHLWSWERPGRATNHSQGPWYVPDLSMLVESSRFLLPIVAGAASSVAFCLNPIRSLNGWEVVGLGVSVFGLFFSLYLTHAVRMKIRSPLTVQKTTR